MVLRCDHRTWLEVGLCFQLGWQDRESPAQIMIKESRLVGGEEVIEVKRPAGHPSGDGGGPGWGGVEDLQSGRCGKHFVVTLMAGGRGHKAMD